MCQYSLSAIFALYTPPVFNNLMTDAIDLLHKFNISCKIFLFTIENSEKYPKNTVSLNSENTK